MTAQAAIYGRLGADPVERVSQAGTPWATASLAVDLGDGQSDQPPVWFSIIAFGRTAEALAKHRKGDLLSASGSLRMIRWEDREGNARETLQIVADAVVSARTVRPGGRRPKQASE